MPFDELFADRIREAIGDNVADFARRAGLGPNGARSIANWRTNPTSIKPENLVLIADTAGKKVSWFFGEKENAESPLPTTVRIPLLNVEAAAGVGKFVEQFEMVEEFEFPEKFLRRLGGNPRTTHCIRVKHDSDSMTPTIEPRALLMVDVSQKDWPKIRSASARRKQAPDVYVFIHGDAGVRIKRIETLEHDYRALISDNAAGYPPEIVKRDPITIIGKVIWWDNRL